MLAPKTLRVAPPRGNVRLGAAQRRTTQPLQTPAGVPLRVPVHPGHFLDKHYLQPLGINQTRAAQLLGVSRRRVNELVMGHRAMSPDTAVRCALAFGANAAFWLHLQANWDAFHAWRALRAAMGAQARRAHPSARPTAH